MRHKYMKNVQEGCEKPPETPLTQLIKTAQWKPTNWDEIHPLSSKGLPSIYTFF